MLTSVIFASTGEKLMASGSVWVASSPLCRIDKYGPCRLPCVLIGSITGWESTFRDENVAEVTYRPAQPKVNSTAVIVVSALSPIFVALTAPLTFSAAFFVCALTSTHAVFVVVPWVKWD